MLNQIPTPDELRARQDAAHDAAASAVCSKIISAMINAHGTSLSVPLDEYPTNGVVAVVRSRFKERGWRVDFKSAQRDGSWVEVSPL